MENSIRRADTDEDKVAAALLFLGCIRKGANSDHPLADLPSNKALRLNSNGICDILEAILRDGDVERAVNFASDMPMRFQLLGEPSTKSTAKPGVAQRSNSVPSSPSDREGT